MREVRDQKARDFVDAPAGDPADKHYGGSWFA